MQDSLPPPLSDEDAKRFFGEDNYVYMQELRALWSKYDYANRRQILGENGGSSNVQWEANLTATEAFARMLEPIESHEAAAPLDIEVMPVIMRAVGIRIPNMQDFPNDFIENVQQLFHRGDAHISGDVMDDFMINTGWRAFWSFEWNVTMTEALQLHDIESRIIEVVSKMFEWHKFSNSLRYGGCSSAPVYRLDGKGTFDMTITALRLK